MIHNLKRVVGRACLFAAVTLATVIIVYAWGSTAHRFLNLKAAANLPASMGWFRADSVFFQLHATDPDTRRVSSDTTFYAEQWRHYIDIDGFPNFHNLPHDLDSAILLYGYEAVKTAGLNPWATVWVLDSLTAQLARGDTTAAKQTASDLGHYVADAHQPLHAAVNYDGQLTGNNGIHSRYETTMINNFQSFLTVHPDTIHYVSSPIDYVFNYLYHTNSLVDSVLAGDNYAKSASGWTGSGTAPTAYYNALWAYTKNFTLDQLQRATIAIASLWYTAWVNASSAQFVSQPESLNFGNVPVGQSRQDSITVSNSGIDTLTISSAVCTNPVFSVVPTNAIVPPGESRRFRISFTPSEGSARIDTLIVVHNAPDSPRKIILRGAGLLSTVHVSVAARWNLISNPVQTANDSVRQLFPPAIYPYAYAFRPDSGYVARGRMTNGTGYWAKFTSGQSVSVMGVLRANDSLHVTAGWNLIGSVSDTVSTLSITPLNTSIESPFYEYANGYHAAGTIEVGKGYWVKVSSAGQLVLSSSSTIPVMAKIHMPAVNVDNLNRLSVEDGNGNRQTLYFGVSAMRFDEYQLPPVPPLGIFDARFSSNRFVEAVEEGRQMDAPISISSSAYPVKIRWNIRQESTSDRLVIGGNEVLMAGDGTAEILSPGVRVVVRMVTGSLAGIPHEFALGQNYPNPFNPSTEIHYALPEDAKVSLKVFDLLGAVVATLVESEQKAGYHSAVWRADNLSSGVYFYRFDAAGVSNPRNAFSRVKKMAVIR